MGLVDLMQHMSMERQQDSRRRRAQATNGLVASRDKIKASPCQRDNDSQGGELDIQIPNLPEDIWLSYTFPDANARCCPSCVCLSCFSTILEMPSQPYFLWYNTGWSIRQCRTASFSTSRS
ncbi:uncharacterized protein LOC120682631 isoform X2 [Panicum virgatum]|uniref:uncharacterized protein LOC120682631 isoform X2 n=1 Tax=Panicum virgatum TaxID=38727 RepID=UPI0019D626FA|nr:uncharacterized protein LOC120682631 isoform X2 [Panicum virgatum]